MNIRDKESKEAFIQYLVEHPEERFFQALTNFVFDNTSNLKDFKVDVLGHDWLDPFYLEEADWFINED